MSGILESMKAQLDANTAEIATLKSMIANIGTGTVAQTAAAAAAAPADPFAALSGGTTAAAAAAPTHVTPEMIMELIQPHLANEAVKAKLGEAMRSMGIDNLNNVQAHQYGDLYVKFQAVVSGAGAATGGGASII